MSKDGKLVLICASDDDRVEVREAETMKLKYYLPSGPDPELFILSPEDDTLYIANEDDAMVTVVDMNDKMIVDDIPVGVEPEGMGLTNDGKFWSIHQKPLIWHILLIQSNLEILPKTF